ncbi:MAG: hypothetical protein GY791_14375 [Alphaproteobacteria bacterium]|nr:hypothetical protein [Alphaproteobacteria bacterium]
MSKLRRALDSLPARPAVFISAALIVGVLLYRYGGEYLDCSAHAGLRDRLHRAVEQAAGGANGGRVVLAEVTDFAWSRADIQVNFKPEVEVPGCPLGWDWSTEERAALVADDLLTVIVFSQNGALVNFLEYRSDWGVFRDAAGPFTPETAVFAATDEGGSVILSPVRQPGTGGS